VGDILPAFMAFTRTTGITGQNPTMARGVRFESVDSLHDLLDLRVTPISFSDKNLCGIRCRIGLVRTPAVDAEGNHHVVDRLPRFLLLRSQPAGCNGQPVLVALPGEVKHETWAVQEQLTLRCRPWIRLARVTAASSSLTRLSVISGVSLGFASRSRMQPFMVLMRCIKISISSSLCCPCCGFRAMSSLTSNSPRAAFHGDLGTDQKGLSGSRVGPPSSSFSKLSTSSSSARWPLLAASRVLLSCLIPKR
jgi:hypothetical protein